MAIGRLAQLYCSEPSAHSYAIGIACLFTLVVRFKVGTFSIGFQGSFYFAICIWGALALPILLESAAFVRLHRFVIGRLLDWLSVLACIIMWWSLRR